MTDKRVWQRISYSALISIALLLVLAKAWVQITMCNDFDIFQLLLDARMLLNGKTLYQDIFEVNPPLIIWLYTIPVSLAAHSGITDVKMLSIICLSLIAVSITVSTRLFASHPFFADKPHARPLFAVWLAVLFIVYPDVAWFGDREHLFVVLTFPYLLRLAPSLSMQPISFRQKILIGIMAGIGFSIKPHCVIVLVGVNLVRLVRMRTLSVLFIPENICIAAIMLTYAGSVWVFTPEYLHIVLPMAMATYGDINDRLKGLLTLGIIGLLSLAMTFLTFRLRDHSAVRKDIFYLLIICALMMAYALANNGWGYTFLPMMIYLMFLNSAVLCEYHWLRQEYIHVPDLSRRFMYGTCSCIFNAGVQITLVSIAAAITYLVHLSDPCKDGVCYTTQSHSRLFKNVGSTFLNTERIVWHAAHIAHEVHASSFGAISSYFAPWVLLERDDHLLWVTRFNHFWMLPTFINSASSVSQEKAWIMPYVGNSFAQDLENHQPDLLFIEDGPYFGFAVKHRVDLIHFIGAYSPDFTRVLTQYHYMQTLDECFPIYPGEKRIMVNCRFDVYVRGDITSQAPTAPQITGKSN